MLSVFCKTTGKPDPNKTRGVTLSEINFKVSLNGNTHFTTMCYEAQKWIYASEMCHFCTFLIQDSTQTVYLFLHTRTHTKYTQTAVTFYQLENHFCPLSKLKNTHVLEHSHIPLLTVLLITFIEIVQ